MIENAGHSRETSVASDRVQVFISHSHPEDKDYLNPSSMLERLFTLHEACGYLRCKKSHLYALMSGGELNWSQIGRKRLIPESDLRGYVERGRDASKHVRRPSRGGGKNGSSRSR